jgi:hypothetical protein
MKSHGEAYRFLLAPRIILGRRAIMSGPAPVCIENVNMGAVVMLSAQDGA